MSEVRKVPLFVEIIGEPSVGKTHLSCLFPKPALLDTTPKGEGYYIIRKLYPEEWKQRYFRVRCFKDVMIALEYVRKRRDFFKTVVVDTGADLRSLAIDACLEELRKEKPERQRLMPEEYSCVNKKVNGFIDEVTDPERLCMNLVFTAQMKDEWVDRRPTGRRVRDGYPKANFQADIRLYLELKRKVDEKTMKYLEGYERVCRVIKCRFRDMTSEEWIAELKELNWEGIKKLTKLKEEEIVE